MERSESTSEPSTVGRPPTRGTTGNEEYDSVQREPTGSEQQASLVLNLSQRALSEIEVRVLEKGLGYVPTPSLDLFKLNYEMHEFFRKIRLKIFFKDRTERLEEDDTGLRNKSSFNPPVNTLPPEVITFENAVLKDINACNQSDLRIFHNTSKEELIALRVLGNDSSIVIKPSDKGGATVIWDVNDYRRECRRLLSDNRNYRHLDQDPSTGLAQSIRVMVDHSLNNDWISQKEAQFLICTEPRIPYFYILPKVHKHLTNPPGRPIVSGVGSLLEPVSKFGDFFLRPLVQKTNTYLKDRKDVLQLLR